MSLCEDCIKGVQHEGTPTGKIEVIGGVKCYVATPTVDYPKDKVVLYLPDVFGIELPNAQLLIDDFANNGFKTIAPEYLNGGAIPADALDPGKTYDLMKWLESHGADKTRPPLDNVIQALRDQGVTRIGATGYCFGGRYVFNLAFDNVIDVAVASHPSLLQIPADLEKYAATSKAPLLLNTCTTDTQFPLEAQSKADELFGNGKFAPGYRREYFEGCTHGFAVRGDMSVPAVKAGKEGAFKAAVEWFQKNLTLTWAATMQSAVSPLPMNNSDTAKGGSGNRGRRGGGNAPTPSASGQGQGQGSGKMRGMNKDTPQVRLSKTISWLLRHGAKGEGLVMREDGYVRVDDLLVNKRIKSQGLTLEGLKEIVKDDVKQRYGLLFEADEGVWWIRANQGHSMKVVKVDMKPVLSMEDIPTKTAVHGTSITAWTSIANQGLSKMKRNHIHLAQDVPGDRVISGMRKSSQILIYINVQKAIDAGIDFYLSDNGVVLTEGDENGFIKPEYFHRVVTARGQVLLGES
ncbi:hypothetical protein AX17_006941 [Amanita inopinata Kibby_2008]|nr:hypothetical protein AX17_006941 [Amanita inopinata Kibby_2008]